MSLFNLEKNRRIVPRWRSYSSARNTGELYMPKNIKTNLLKDDFFIQHQKNWEAEKSITNAIELMNYSLVSSNFDYAQDAIEFIIGNKKNVGKETYRIALSINTNEEDSYLISNNNTFKSLQLTIQTEIHKIKKVLINWPRNAVLWIELSRLYTILGYKNKATKAMITAMSLSGTNRYIIRSAARFFIHFDDPERARNIIQNVNNFKDDPWLLSSEIAISTILNKTSKTVDFGISILKRDLFGSKDISDLASAIATIEFNEGNIKKSKKLFNKSLENPNDNSLAQAEWAKSNIKSLIIPDGKNIPHSFEASARHAMRIGDWNSTMESCVNWIIDEPYSSRPATLGSYVTSLLVSNYECGEEFCNFGLLSNPGNIDLKNNLSVILAYQGKLLEARKIFESIGKIELNSRSGIITTATSGLINFREKKFDAGRALYKSAIEKAKNQKMDDIVAAAYLHYAREEINAQTENSDFVYNEAMKIANKYKSLEIKQMEKTLKKLYSDKKNLNSI